MEHKEIVVVCEKSWPIHFNYNVLLTTSENNIIITHVVHVVIIEPSIQWIVVNEMVELTIN